MTSVSNEIIMEIIAVCDGQQIIALHLRVDEHFQSKKIVICGCMGLANPEEWFHSIITSGT